MIKKFLYISTFVFVLTSCGSTKKATVTETPKPVAPEGIEFATVKTKDFTSINVPVSGDLFKLQNSLGEYNPDVEVEIEPMYARKHLSFIDNFLQAEGSMDEILEVVKTKRLNDRIKENSEVKFEKTTIGAYDAIHFEVKTLKKTGAIDLDYGYLVHHDNKAACFGIFYASLSPSSFTTHESVFNETLKYVAETAEFK